MTKKIGPIFYLVILIAFCSNVSQPGIYNAGGTAFSMLFPQDSLTYKKVQMQEESIYIQLYKGFAVVKGTYKMVNNSNEKLHFTMGYPINGIYNGGEADLNQVQLDSLYKFKIKASGNELPINEMLIGDSGNATVFKNENWFTWFVAFSPKEIKEIEVYFLVNTNEGGITKGYTQKQKNAFIYLLESGSVWKQPIEKGKFIVELKDGLKISDIAGISSHFNFQVNQDETILIGAKTDFSPIPKDNLIVTYGEKIPNFNFQYFLDQSEDLFNQIDVFSQQTEFRTTKPFISKNPYEIEPDFWSFLPVVALILAFITPFAFGVFGIYFVIKSIKKKNRN
ncbi:hypothetical protein NHF50_10325 [Flavobacterium sp. NRK F10]|uniref:hypothetical protein n=1 Tax=Flavobacterium sp. NRK F10 TaxID=2954931 RepID=UPI002090AC2A|nr:hypothetical protein [Flavobacterium sp. NRK F10]MCO6175438.1 hypothetical protein [Flavobacterium sp. NRK F10]